MPGEEKSKEDQKDKEVVDLVRIPIFIHPTRNQTLLTRFYAQSPEDQQKKDDIALIVERTTDPEPGVQKMAIQSLHAEVKGSKT